MNKDFTISSLEAKSLADLLCDQDDTPYEDARQLYDALIAALAQDGEFTFSITIEADELP